MSDFEVYKTPEANLSTGTTSESELLFFPTSQNKLLVLFVATFGVYTVYWFYKNWRIQQSRMDKKIIPALRAIFYIFFTHSLFDRIEKAAEQKAIEKSWSAATMATIFVVLTIVSNILDRISRHNEVVGVVDYVGILMLFFLVYPLCKVQEVVNEINGDKEGKINSTFSIYNYIFIALGAAFWFLVLVGLFGLDPAILDGFDG